ETHLGLPRFLRSHPLTLFVCVQQVPDVARHCLTCYYLRATQNRSQTYAGPRRPLLRTYKGRARRPIVPVQDSMRRRARDRASEESVASKRGPSSARDGRKEVDHALELVADDLRVQVVTALFLIGLVEKSASAHRSPVLTPDYLLDLLRTVKR